MRKNKSTGTPLSPPIADGIEPPHYHHPLPSIVETSSEIAEKEFLKQESSMKHKLKKERTDFLHRLLQKSLNTAEDFSEAASDVSDQLLRDFLVYADQRHKRFSDQLSSIVVDHGELPEEGASLVGELHQIWIDLRARFASNDNLVILEECQKFESSLKQTYTSALERTDWSEETRKTLEDHYEQLAEILKRIEKLIPLYGKINS